MPAYLIADTDITDPERYEEYKRQAAPLVERFGGRYCARGGKHEVLEGDFEPVRLVVLEFPDMESLKAWYNSPEYAPVKAIRQEAAKSRLIALEGM
ncbi:MAG: DUF1330 domain-containing protein [Actinomycetota bacterium]|jgi:uncharacterized protein (DUF1330 family)|nr:DUF1330 domain-containing protein [Actinomycetota bacterium]